MIPELIPKETLQEKLDAIKNLIPENQWWYYHIGSIQNFIFHLDNIPSERTKARTAKNIDDYLSKLAEKIKEVHDYRVLCKELTPHVWTISRVFRDELGFIGKPFYPFLFVALLILFFFLNHYYSTTIALGLVSVIALTRIVYCEVKIKLKKVY